MTERHHRAYQISKQVRVRIQYFPTIMNNFTNKTTSYTVNNGRDQHSNTRMKYMLLFSLIN